MHWFVSKRRSIVLFDVTNEVFDEMALSEELSHIVSVSGVVVLSVLNDLLAVCTVREEAAVGHPGQRSACSVWVMEEYCMSESWMELHSFLVDGQVTGFDGFMRNGELLMVIDDDERVSWNPVTLTIRKSSTRGRAGESASHGLTENLQHLGFETDRLKTGTPACVDSRTVDFSGLEPQHGDEEISWFRFDPEFHIEREQMCCYLMRTTKSAHQLIEENLHETPTYGGWVEAKGPRCCPSIEDKIVRFKDKESHQIFLNRRVIPCRSSMCRCLINPSCHRHCSRCALESLFHQIRVHRRFPRGHRIFQVVDT